MSPLDSNSPEVVILTSEGLRIRAELSPARAHVRLQGRLEYASCQTLLDFCQRCLDQGDLQALDLNLDTLRTVDSAALGCFMQIRQQAQAKGIPVRLMNCRGAVQQTLMVANFHRLFDCTFGRR